MKPRDWTVGSDGRSNSSPAFDQTVEVVRQILLDHRLGQDPGSTARLIVAQLAHVYGFGPTADDEKGANV
jgi:hypothetical protein